MLQILAILGTAPERTILDQADAATQPEQIQMAVAQALLRGWLNVARLRHQARARERRVAGLIERALITAADRQESWQDDAGAAGCA